MPARKPKEAALGAAAAAGVATAAAAEPPRRDVEELIAKIKGKDENARTDAWVNAGRIGAPAVEPLATVMADPDLETARAAKRGLWKIVRRAGRPEADRERKAAVAELAPLLEEGHPDGMRREVLWMLSEIGGKESVKPVAALLQSRELREDARCALERIPGGHSLKALQAAFDSVGDDFKQNIVQSLRKRGVDVEGFPCVKRKPTKETQVKPLA
ncbi:MAG TPA: hypothetical protein VM492_13310 [Sumerlaeia bacterium]|nr:hypothetical protein [Sumerlaeia bacterium]